MRGELEGSSVFIRNVREASQTYSKGCFGYPLSGGFLELDLVRQPSSSPTSASMSTTARGR